MFKQNQNQQNAQNQMFLSYTKYVAYNKKIWLIVRTQKQMHLVLKVTISKRIVTYLKALTGGLVRVISANDPLTSSYRAIVLT